MTTIYKFLSYLYSLDVKLWVESDHLRCNAPEEALTPDLIAQISERKAEIIAFLNQANLASNSTSQAIQPVSRERNLSLSFAQQRLWFLQQLEPGNPFYNEHVAIQLTGLLDVASLEQSLNEMVQRHEALRTTFKMVEAQPVQIIAPNLTLTLPVVDLRQLPKAVQKMEVQGLATEQSQRPFDLLQGPLLRWMLVQLSEQEHVLLFNIHHIVFDGWSLGIIIRELSALYQAFSTGKPSPLPKLPIQYADFAVWQRQQLQGEKLHSQLSYWKQQLEKAPPLLPLPTDRPRPPVQTYRGEKESFRLPKSLTETLKTVGKKAEATLFMTLLAVFKILLYRYSGQEDIIVGSPIANRNRAEIEGLIGFFLNTLVLRTDFSGNPTFEELLGRVRQVTMEAYDHQDLPFEKLVEELQPERNANYNPLFQVSFVLQNTPKVKCELPWLTLTPVKVKRTRALLDLRLDITETDSGLEGFWEYNTDLFDAATISRMSGYLQTLLEAIAANPQQRVDQLPLLSEAERHQLLTEWNDTESEYPSDKCIHQLFEEQVKRTPDAIALVLENQQLTYRQLNQRANQLAHYLRSLSVGSGVLVGICIEPSLDLVVSLLGVLKAGGVYVPLDPNYPQERLVFMLEDANVHVLLTQEPLTEKISLQHAHIVCLDRDRDAIAKESVENLDCQATLDDLAYAIYTSGSTGRPKAVLGKNRGIVNRLHWMWETLPFGADEICCQKTSINFVDHVAEIFSPLLKGIPLVVVPDNIRGDIPRLMSLLSDNKITRIVLVPSLLKAMLDNAPQQLTQLRYLKYVFCSGEALPLTLAEAFHQKLSSARLFNIYGSSEVAADVTCFEVNFWETRQRILQYFKPEVVRGATENQVLGVHQKPFTKPGVSPEMLATKFQRSELPSYPLTVDDYYDKLSEEVLPYAIDTGSPTFIGHMTSALPDFMHDMSKMISRLNQNLVKIETSKSLMFLEREAIAILHRLVYNFSGEFYEENIQQKNRNLGIITTGGTTANISALLCARNSGLLNTKKSGNLSKESLYKVLSKKGYDDIVIIGSRLMHYSFNKAASMLGLGTDNIVFIDSNDDGKLDLNLLKERIRECSRNKLYILALVGIAGTTETGEIDPLFELGDIAQEFGIHFHVDAAWGGATIFSEKHKGKLKGINKADSITICGHKQLYLPQGISVCLFKDPQMLNFAETTARYQAQRDTFDVGRFTIEGSRSALSLCLHGALHIIGKRGYEILIDNGIEKAQYFSRLIELLEPFDLVMEPGLNIVNYRYIPENLRAKSQQNSLSDDDIQRINQLNTQIQREQFEQGLTFVSKSTLMDTAYGKDKEIIVFRAVLSNPNTTATDLQSVLEDQLRIANQIEARSQGKLDGIKNLPVQRSDSSGTETAIVKEAIHLQLADDPKADLGEALEDYMKKNTIPIGKPISNTQIYILDKYGNLLPPGVTGELYVGGDGLAQGYLNLPELTQEKFIPNPFAKEIGKSQKAEEERLYRTGDLARWLPDGNIEFLGRIDHQVKIRGFRIELGEIEAVLNTHPQIQQAVVIATEDTAGNKRLVTYIVTRDESLTSKQLREFLFSKLPEYMVPSAFVTLDTLPLTPNGKVDRKALPAPDGEISREHEYVAPRTASEEIIANIFASVIGVQKVGIHDNFFELGGHSLLATQIISRMREAFLMELSLRSLFEKPTVAGISEQVENIRLTTQKQQSFTTAAFGVREEGIL
ncbi:MAG: aminotransferase class V-fold PLP-dependent enzyme [Coleofasciculus sp. B1-GNL1-01]|uniref:aminotransferase class V-fold PLP-dependent enzyme n=1 Tax=Coleofasciculus sp. B1-GNL1-01 TaxID=3068484 RepID=UPI003300974D